MKLDRNINPDGRGKYALVKLRAIRDLPVAVAGQITQALKILQNSGIVDMGDTPDTEFFVIRLRDAFAPPALMVYADAASVHDPEYAQEIQDMVERSVNYPNKKFPD